MNLILIVILALALAGCSHPQPKHSATPLEASTQAPTEAEAQNSLERIEHLVLKKKYEDAVAAYDSAIERFKSLPIEGDSYSNYGDYIRSLKAKTLCLKTHDPEKRFRKRSELQAALKTALKTADVKALARAFSCHTMIGVPYSEFDEVFNPEHLADEITKQRTPKTKIQVKERGTSLWTSGYADGSVRLFQFEDWLGPGWSVLGIVVGDAEMVEKMLTDQASGQ